MAGRLPGFLGRTSSPMTDCYAVVGNPVEHSKSPQIHAAFARLTGQEIEYSRILAPLDGFAAAVDDFRLAGGKGLNVTVPFKFEAFQLADQLTPRAERALAVNTLRFNGKSILGDNTDGAGLVADIECNHGFPICGKATLLMGAGGAGHGVAPSLLEAGAVLTVVDLDAADADRLATVFQPGVVSSCNYTGLGGGQFDLIINATSCSLLNILPPLPSGIFAHGALAYDLMYGRDTPFMKFAREQGAALAVDGLGMLVEQAAESFFIWRGIRPDTAPVLAQLRNS
jgi:shikimate dehydrogenase